MSGIEMLLEYALGELAEKQDEIERLREEVRGLTANAYNLTERGDKYLRELAEARELLVTAKNELSWTRGKAVLTGNRYAEDRAAEAIAKIDAFLAATAPKETER